MPLAFDPKHFHFGVHRRLWLVLAAVLAFLLAAIWSQPVG